MNEQGSLCKLVDKEIKDGIIRFVTIPLGNNQGAYTTHDRKAYSLNKREIGDENFEWLSSHDLVVRGPKGTLYLPGSRHPLSQKPKD